jgi:Fe-S-cluster containining protein
MTDQNKGSTRTRAEEIQPQKDQAGFQRPGAERDIEVDIFEGVRQADGNPVEPVRLQADDSICFSCHKSISCWNRCCHEADVTLTPADILMLTKKLGMQPAEFLTQYTIPAIWEKSDMPVAKLRTEGQSGEGACVFLAGDEGCGVYDARPATCRYYPMGLASIKMMGATNKEDFNFLVKESHCKGHAEDKSQTVAEFRAEQGVEALDAINRGWIDIMMKMVSWRSVGGPHAKQVSPQAKKMFFMVSTDVDSFRRFIFETRFLDTYVIDPDVVEILKTDDIALLQLGFDWLKNILFNEQTINMKEDVLQAAIARGRSEMGAT